MNELHPHNISVITPIGEAIEKTKSLLFRPFDFGRWFTIGFCAWLAMLGQGGFRFRPPFGPRSLQNHSGEQIFDAIMSRLPLIITVGSVLFVVSLAVMLVLLWLSSRGRFMFLYCIAQNKAEVKAPWHKYRTNGNSLFLFLLAVGVIGLICLVLFIGVIVLLVVTFGRSSAHVNLAGVSVIIFSVLIAVILMLAFGLTLKFTNDFVVPIMYNFNCSCVEAWGEFWELLKTNAGKFALYILFQIVITMAVGAIVMMVVLLTCCCAACLMMIPYIGTVVMLPLLVFGRSYSLCYLAQYGRDYDAFIPVQAPVSPPPEPQQ